MCIYLMHRLGRKLRRDVFSENLLHSIWRNLNLFFCFDNFDGALWLFLSRSFLRSNISFGIRNISLIFDITYVIQTIVQIINLHSFFVPCKFPEQGNFHYITFRERKWNVCEFDTTMLGTWKPRKSFQL